MNRKAPIVAPSRGNKNYAATTSSSNSANARTLFQPNPAAAAAAAAAAPPLAPQPPREFTAPPSPYYLNEGFALPLRDVVSLMAGCLPPDTVIDAEATEMLAALAVEFIAFLNSEAHALAAMRHQLSEEAVSVSLRATVSNLGAAMRRQPGSPGWNATPLSQMLQSLRMDLAAASSGGILPPYGPVPSLEVDGEDVVRAAQTLGFTSMSDSLAAALLTRRAQQTNPPCPTVAPGGTHPPLTELLSAATAAAGDMRVEAPGAFQDAGSEMQMDNADSNGAAVT